MQELKTDEHIKEPNKITNCFIPRVVLIQLKFLQMATSQQKTCAVSCNRHIIPTSSEVQEHD
jgi:hypothetical protein